MSKPSSSVFATRLVSAASRLTPRLMLPDLTITARLRRLRDLASSSAECPVVPMMCTLPAAQQLGKRRCVAAGMVKSIRPSALGEQRLGVGAELDAVGGRARPARRRPGRSAASPAPRARPRAQALGLGDRLDQRAPHAPAGAGHDQPHVGIILVYALRLRLRAVVAFDDDQIGDGIAPGGSSGSPDIPASGSRPPRSHSRETRSPRCASGSGPRGTRACRRARRNLPPNFLKIAGFAAA